LQRGSLIWLSLLLLIRCSAESEQPVSPAATTPRAGGTLTIALRAEPGSWNPYTAQDEATARVLSLLYPQLVKERWQDGEITFEPWLAERFELDSAAQALRVLLRKASWSDRQPVTVDDLLATHRVRTSAALGWSGATLAANATPEAVGALEVRYRFGRLTFLSPFVVNDGPIVPARYSNVPFENWAQLDWKSMLASCGPFRLESAVAGQEVLLVRDPAWWGDPPAWLDRVLFRVYPDETLAAGALENGEVDLLERIPPSRAARIRQNPKLRLIEIPALTLSEVIWNVAPTASRPMPHLDPGVRRALSLALDREDLIASAAGGFGIPGDTPVLSSLWAHDGAPPPRFDPVAAEQQLEQLGWIRPSEGPRQRAGQPLSIRLLVNAESASKRDLAARLASMVALVGGRFEIDAVPRAEFNRRVWAKQFEAVLISMRIGTTLDVELHTRDIGGQGLNFGSWSDPVADQWLDAAADASTREQAKQAWHRWQERVRSQQPVTVLFEERTLIGLSRRVRSATPSPLDPYENLHRWWIDDSSP
jgi:peptide/nickel transport system substrate-binding protein